MFATKPAIVLALKGWTLDPWLRRLHAADPERDIIVAETSDLPLPARYYLFCWKPAPALLAREPKPLLILSGGAGVDHILRNDPPHDVPITRIVDADLTGRMVEYIVLHCLYHLRRMDTLVANQRSGIWKSEPLPAARQVTVGIMGVGELGQAAASGLQAVGFDVIGWGRTARPGLAFPSYAGASGRDAFLAKTDILVSLLPSTGQTRGMLDAALFKRLRRNAPFGPPVFINAGRGDTANESDLALALTDGTLRAASLDVFETEPLPRQSPLWSLPNVVVTPHNAADSHPDAVVAAVMTEISRHEAGLPPLNGIDRQRGY